MIEPLVAIQGGRGTFSEYAAMSLVPEGIVVPQKEPRHLFDAIDKGEADFAVIPIENVYSGSAFIYYDLLLQYAAFSRGNRRIRIIKEATINIRHNLVSHPQARLKDLTEICSHPNALAQCANYIKRNRFSPKEASDTAVFLDDIRKAFTLPAAEQERLLRTAVIASVQAAHDYGMRVLDRDIHDRSKNYTRFLLLAPITSPLVEKELGTQVKISIAFIVDNDEGTLFKALSAFGSRAINVVRLETRPIHGTNTEWYKFEKGEWDLIYFVDFEGNARDCLNALDHLAQLVQETDGDKALSFLGLYRPAHDENGKTIVDEEGSGKLWGAMRRTSHRKRASTSEIRNEEIR